MTTKGFRVDAFGMISYISDETAGKAKYQIIRHARECGWCLPRNAWSGIYSCTRWREGDGLAATCHKINDFSEEVRSA